jgi:hypothetical protein
VLGRPSIRLITAVAYRTNRSKHGLVPGAASANVPLRNDQRNEPTFRPPLINDRTFTSLQLNRFRLGLANQPWFHFRNRAFGDLRSRTPGPPPFSSMNSTPADSKARRTARSFAAVMDVSSSVSSARRIVATLRDERLARSSALHRTSERAALIWALVKGRWFTLTHLSAYAIFYSISGLSSHRITVFRRRHFPFRRKA